MIPILNPLNRNYLTTFSTGPCAGFARGGKKKRKANCIGTKKRMVVTNERYASANKSFGFVLQIPDQGAYSK